MTPCALGSREYAHIFIRVAMELRQRACSFESEFRAPKGRIGYPAFTTFVERVLKIYWDAGGTRTYTTNSYANDNNPSFTGEAVAFILEATRHIEPTLRAGGLPPVSQRQDRVGEIIRNLIRKRKKKP